jgi:hypothetical protein
MKIFVCTVRLDKWIFKWLVNLTTVDVPYIKRMDTNITILGTATPVSAYEGLNPYNEG